MTKLFLLDAFALIYRSYYAFIKNPRYSSKGQNTSAILGFTNTLMEVLEKQKPSHIAVVFDPKGKTFRHETYKEYKAQRPPMPEDIRSAIPYIEKIIKGFNIPCISMDGYEADDIIGTLAHKATNDGFDKVYMMTPDKDFAQLVTDKIFMFKPKRMGKEEEIWGIKEVKESFEVEKPLQVIDILGLMGDTADNIPGCPGIGPKTAQKLIATYHSIENLYKHTEELKGKQKENIVANKDKVLLSKELATIKLDVPISLEVDRLKCENPNKEVLKDIFKELEFATLARRLFNKKTTATTVNNSNSYKADALQGSLWENTDDEDQEESHNQAYIPLQQNFLMDTEELRKDLRADMCIMKQYSLCLILSEEVINTNSNILGMSITLGDKESFYVPIEDISILKEFKHIFADKDLTMIAHNTKEVLLSLYWQGIEVKNKLWDTLLAHYILQPELKHSIDYVANQMLKYVPPTLLDLLGKGRNHKKMSDLTVEELQNYACEQSIITLQLHKVLGTMLDKNGATNLFDKIEIPLVSVLAKMEHNGANIDCELLSNYCKKLEFELNSIEKEIKQMAGEPDLNIASPKQLGNVLFGKMQLSSKAKKTSSGQYSTAEAVLVKLRNKHPIIEKLLDYRSLSKLISTYVSALPTYISPISGRIHTSFNQAETSTGRLSSTNPNLQNIPIRTKRGRYIRKAFVASDENHIFLSADYSQIELRIMAHLSGDESMKEAFNKNEDIHATTASKIFKVSISEVTSEMRRQAKTANFGIIYGVSAWGLAERLGISRSEGRQLIDGYFDTYPQVKKFIKDSIDKAREKGYVETIMSRRRYLKDINSNNAIVRGVAERNAVNSPIQGSAADVIKIAMIRIYKAMQAANLQSEMILQVHDELNFNCMKDEKEELMKIIKVGMEGAVNLDVPLVADIGSGQNWLEAH